MEGRLGGARRSERPRHGGSWIATATTTLKRSMGTSDERRGIGVAVAIPGRSPPSVRKMGMVDSYGQLSG